MVIPIFAKLDHRSGRSIINGNYQKITASPSICGRWITPIIQYIYEDMYKEMETTMGKDMAGIEIDISHIH